MLLCSLLILRFLVRTVRTFRLAIFLPIKNRELDAWPEKAERTEHEGGMVTASPHGRGEEERRMGICGGGRQEWWLLSMCSGCQPLSPSQSRTDGAPSGAHLSEQPLPGALQIHVPLSSFHPQIPEWLGRHQTWPKTPA